MLATTYALHFAKNQLVDMYCEMKRSRDEELIADVHARMAAADQSDFTHLSVLMSEAAAAEGELAAAETRWLELTEALE